MRGRVFTAVVLPIVTAIVGAAVSAEFPEVRDEFVAWMGGKAFGPFVVLATNDEGSVDQPVRGYIELKTYNGAIWGDHHYTDGTTRNYSGYLKNGFIVLAYRSDVNGYGEYFLAANSGDLTEFVGHEEVNSCPGQGIQVVKHCNVVMLSAKGRDAQTVENEGLKKFKPFLSQECQDVKFQNTEFDTTRPCPASKQSLRAPLTVDNLSQKSNR
jgi:hypothetical protein